MPQGTTSPLKAELLRRWRGGQFDALTKPADSEPPLEVATVISLEQEMLWNQARQSPTDPGRNQFILIRLDGDVNQKRLARSMQQVVDRHDILRSSYPERAGRPEVVIDTALQIDLEVIALEARDLNGQLQEVDRIRQDIARRSFDIGIAPLFRIVLFRGSSQRHWLFFVVDHIIFDGWSLGLVLRDLQNAYNGAAMAPPGKAFRYYAAIERMDASTVPAEVVEHLDQLFRSPNPVPALPVDYRENRDMPTLARRKEFALPAHDVDAIGQVARALKTTPHLILLACLSIWAGALSGKQSVLIYTPTANRQNPAFIDTVGIFRAPLLLRIDLAMSSSFAELLSHVAHVVQQASRHGEACPVSLQLTQAVERYNIDENSIFNVGMITQNFPKHLLKLQGVNATIDDVHYGNGGRGISFIFDDVVSFSGYARYNGALFSEESMDYFIGKYVKILSHALSNTSTSIRDIYGAS